MRVLLLSQFYAPVVGGEERVVEDTARALARRGHEVGVATLTQADGATTAGDGVRVHRLRSSAGRVPGLYQDRDRPHALPVPDPEVMLGLRRVLERDRPDVVHAHNWLVHSYLPLRRLGGPPLLLSLHDYSLVCATKRLFRDGAPCPGVAATGCLTCALRQHGLLRGALLVSLTRLGGAAARRVVDLFLPVSETVARASGLVKDRLPFRVLPNFVASDLDAAAPTQAEKLDLPPTFVLYVGDATPDKGIDVVLDAHARLHDAPPLIVIGRPYSARLRSAGANVHVLGPRSHAVAIDAMRRSTVVVVPSLVLEAFGMVALEAMALGRPLIASRTGGLAELVEDSVDGLLVEPGDAHALRDALAGLLSDSSRRNRLGAAARERANDFAEAALVPRLEDSYRAVLAADSSGRLRPRRRTR